MWAVGVLALSMTGSVPPEPLREYRGAWVATVDNIDWPSKPGLPVDKQKQELRAIVATAEEVGLNMLVFQVRTSADALYPSEIEPSSWFLTGEQGAKIGWDPLEFMIEECHRSGIELHAWINPFRAGHPSQKGAHASSHVSRSGNAGVVEYGKFLWMDPGDAALRKRTIAVAKDIVSRYDVDGLHIDDYFYPYPTGNDFPDSASYGRYRAEGGSLDRESWRRENVDTLVRELGSVVHSTKPWVKFGISPFGIYRPGVPEGIKAGVDQYAQLYADARKWLNEGWCDYMVPQLYWKQSSSGQPFEPLLQWWQGENRQSVSLLAGHFTSQCGPSFGNWPASEIGGQIHIVRNRSAHGSVHFSMRAIQGDWNGVAKKLKTFYRLPALPPPHPRPPKDTGPERWRLWLDGETWRLSSPAAVPVTTGTVVRSVDAYGRISPIQR
ncbi:MAG: glycoside hydrolase family 10 protein [Fimbriimonadaceae bacterium]